MWNNFLKDLGFGFTRGNKLSHKNSLTLSQVKP